MGSADAGHIVLTFPEGIEKATTALREGRIKRENTLVERKHVFYMEVLKGSRITRRQKSSGEQGRTILKIRGTPGRDTLFELLHAATPVCVEVSFFLPGKFRKSL